MVWLEALQTLAAAFGLWPGSFGNVCTARQEIAVQGDNQCLQELQYCSSVYLSQQKWVQRLASRARMLPWDGGCRAIFSLKHSYTGSSSASCITQICALQSILWCFRAKEHLCPSWEQPPTNKSFVAYCKAVCRPIWRASTRLYKNRLRIGRMHSRRPFQVQEQTPPGQKQEPDAAQLPCFEHHSASEAARLCLYSNQIPCILQAIGEILLLIGTSKFAPT